MEVWDVYNKYRELTGKRILRSQEDELKKGEYTLAVHVAIFNEDNEMLIQKRAATKSKYPNKWDVSVGGHSITGENSEDAIQRELFEELGFDYDFSDARPVFTLNYDKGFDDIYVISDSNLDINKLKLQYDEVENVTWASKDEIKLLIDDDKFVPCTDGFIDMLFCKNDMNKGVIKRI